MNVRTTFTILISLSSLVSVAFFSLHIYTELREEIYELMDLELENAASSIFQKLAEAPETSLLQSPTILLEDYWLRVTAQSGRTILTTRLVQYGDIAPGKPGKPYFVKLAIPHEQLNIPDSEKEEVAGVAVKLRALSVSRPVGRETVTVQIAKPVLLLDAELREIMVDMLISIPLTILVIIATAYLVAGRILRPLTAINQRIARIREHSLHERIPLGKSRDELYILSSSLNSMFDRLQHSFARQREFIGNAAHEMKSPLTILMLGHEEMLAANPEPELKNVLEKQLHSMRRLNKLIRDLLSIARLEQEDTVVREQVDLPQLLNQVLENYSEIISARNIQVSTILEPLLISVDQEKIQRLFINLLDNAIKYNLPDNGMLQLEAGQLPDGVFVAIANSGKEIPPEDSAHIFRQFYRVEKSRSQAYGGTGLGLTIALRIAEMHGGTISVTSAGGITTFTVTLPHSLID